MLAGRRVLLGVTGSIAAYQAADLISLLKNEFSSVRVIMTRAAKPLCHAAHARGDFRTPWAAGIKRPSAQGIETPTVTAGIVLTERRIL